MDYIFLPLWMIAVFSTIPFVLWFVLAYLARKVETLEKVKDEEPGSV